MRVGEDEQVASFTAADHDDNAETEKIEEPDPEDIAAAEAEESGEVIEETEPPADDEETEGEEDTEE